MRAVPPARMAAFPFFYQNVKFAPFRELPHQARMNQLNPLLGHPEPSSGNFHSNGQYDSDNDEESPCHCKNVKALTLFHKKIGYQQGEQRINTGDRNNQ